MKTWGEIGKELGIPRQNAWRIGQRALRKIRKIPGALQMLRCADQEVRLYRESLEKGIYYDPRF